MNFSEDTQVFAAWASFQDFRSPKCLISLQDRILWHSHQNSSNVSIFRPLNDFPQYPDAPQLPEFSWEWRPLRPTSHTHARAPRTVYQSSSYTTSSETTNFPGKRSYACWPRVQPTGGGPCVLTETTTIPGNSCVCIYVWHIYIYIYIRNELTPLTCVSWDKN
jgi:hypothetical protein